MVYLWVLREQGDQKDLVDLKALGVLEVVEVHFEHCEVAALEVLLHQVDLVN